MADATHFIKIKKADDKVWRFLARGGSNRLRVHALRFTAEGVHQAVAALVADNPGYKAKAVPIARKPKAPKTPPAPPSPITGLYLVVNSNGCPLFRGDYAGCTAHKATYEAGRKAAGQFPDPCTIKPETLSVEFYKLRALVPGRPDVNGWYALPVASAKPTGNRVKGWWGGMEGGPAGFEEWIAVIGPDAPAYAGLRVRCHREGTSELDFNRVPGRYLTPLEILAD